MKILRTAAAGVALLASLLLIAVWARPPELLRIGANYAAKTVCSNVFIAERYAAGFDAAMPLLGWSMTKSVTAGLIGALVKEGRLALDQHAGWPPGDSRAKISIADRLSMTSGLRFNEGYGAVSDVTRMLFLKSDMAVFAGAQPLEHPVGSVWSYSSGTAVILARIFQDAAGAAPLAAVRERLFEPLGMTSALIETDAHGTLVGSSYMYATARDWARYALFLLQQGVWQGREILPPGYVTMMTTTPGKDPDTEYGLPADIFWMEGHDGQYAAIVPSRDLVIVRLGLTPERDRYRPQPLVRALLDALPQP